MKCKHMMTICALSIGWERQTRLVGCGIATSSLIRMHNDVGKNQLQLMESEVNHVLTTKCVYWFFFLCAKPSFKEIMDLLVLMKFS